VSGAVDLAPAAGVGGQFGGGPDADAGTGASGEDPIGYLDAVAKALRDGRYDELLPTHEQAWLFAAGRHRLPADAPLAVSSIEAFDQIHGKIDSCRLLELSACRSRPGRP
jgi:hypothetical protein